LATPSEWHGMAKVWQIAHSYRHTHTQTHTECNTLQKEIWPKLRGNCNR